MRKRALRLVAVVALGFAGDAVWSDSSSGSPAELSIAPTYAAACDADAPLLSSVQVPVPGDSSSSTLATVFTYAVAGATVIERVPPANWSPQRASAAELAYFGIPPQPADATSLAQWTDEWVDHYGETDPAAPCAQTTPYHFPANSHWSGIEETGGGVTQTYGQAFYDGVTPCAKGQDGWGQWVGIGGDSTRRLIQDGFGYVDGSGKMAPFYEFVDGDHDTGSQPVDLGFSYSPGDKFSFYARYDPDSQSIHLRWHDLSNDHQTPDMEFDDVVTQDKDYLSASHFWDGGTTGEAIDERPVLSDLTILRLSAFGVDYWLRADVTLASGGGSQPIRSLPHQGYHIASHGYDYDTVSSDPDNNEEFDTTWQTCGDLN